MRYTRRSKFAGKRLLWCVTIPAMLSLLGCAEPRPEIGPANSAVAYWTNDAVIIVSLGHLAEDRAWELVEPTNKCLPWSIRLASPEKIKKTLKQWQTLKGQICYFVCPSYNPDTGKNFFVNCVDEDPLWVKNFLVIAALRPKDAEEVGYLLVITAPENVQPVNSELSELGLTDGTKKSE